MITQLLLQLVSPYLFSETNKDKPQKVFKWSELIEHLEGLELDRNWQKYESQGFKRCATFDADGTLWSGDLSRAFVKQLASEKKLSPKALPHLNNVLKFFDQEPATDVYVARNKLTSIFINGEIFRIGKEKGLGKVEVIGKVLGLWNYMLSDMSLVDLGERVTSLFKGGFGNAVFDGSPEMVDYLQKKGFEIYVVSAGVHHVVTNGLNQAGFDLPVSHVRGVKSGVSEGKLTDTLVLPLMDRDGKREMAKTFCGGRPFIAFGDSIDSVDSGMLSSAYIGVAVEPKQKYAELAFEKGYLILDFERVRGGKPAGRFVGGE